MITVTLQTFLSHKLSLVWESVAGVNSAAWRRDVEDVEIVSERQFIEHGKNGKDAYCTITALSPYSHYAVHRRVDGVAGNWAFECKESAAGTILTLAGSVDKKGLAGLAAKAALKKELRGVLKDLERFLAVNAAHTVMIDTQVDEGEGYEELLRRAITTALAAEGMNLPCEINVLITDDEGIHQTNREMRGVDRPTDVLSFPMFDLVPPEKPGAECVDIASGLIPLGDMCISLERCAAQADEFGHGLERELSYLAVHSTLHLLGYDHMDEGEEKARMRAREEAIMAILGIGR